MSMIRKYTSEIPALVLIALSGLVLVGCSSYKINIQQGNFLDQSKIDQVEVGMTRNQVQFLLGTPMVADVFHNNRWDYLFYLKNGKTRQVINRKVTVIFDGDSVLEVQQLDKPAPAES